MSSLNAWLETATRGLSASSAAQVRTEISEHYESSFDAAANAGATTEDAARSALASLGGAKAANCQYRKVLLTSAEARMLRESNWEAHALCSHRWTRWLLLASPAVALIAAAVLYFSGAGTGTRVLLAGGIGLAITCAGPFLPIYTVSRARVFRGLKWVAFPAALAIAFGPDVLKSFWLLISCWWPLVWIEWTRASIRRKLPVAAWPKQLYL